jgi:hypothetical protein
MKPVQIGVLAEVPPMGRPAAVDDDHDAGQRIGIGGHIGNDAARGARSAPVFNRGIPGIGG